MDPLSLNDRSKKIIKLSEIHLKANMLKDIKKNKQARKKKPRSPKESSFYSDEEYSAGEAVLSDDMASITTPMRSRSTVETHSGRPFKPQVDIDDVPKEEGYFHDSQSKFLFYLGEKLHSIPGLEEKPSIKRIYDIIRQIYDVFPMFQLNDFDTALTNLINLYENKNFDIANLAAFKGREIEYILGFFLFWIGRYVVNQKFTKDFAKLVILMYHHLKQNNLKAEDMLDENFKMMINMSAQNFDYEFAKTLKLTKQDVTVYLKDIINLSCSLIYHTLNL